MVCFRQRILPESVACCSTWLRIRSAGGRAALKNLNTVSFLMKRFNKIYLIDSMTKFQNGKQPQGIPGGARAVSPWNCTSGHRRGGHRLALCLQLQRRTCKQN